MARIQDSTTEIWAEIIGTDGVYHVSDKGRVKSILFGRETFLKAQSLKLRSGSKRLRIKIKKKRINVHTLVAEYFLVNSNESSTLIFVDGDTENCAADNLKWAMDGKQEESKKSLVTRDDSLSKALVSCMEGSCLLLGIWIGENQKKIWLMARKSSTTVTGHIRDIQYDDVDEIFQDTILRFIIAIKRGLISDPGVIWAALKRMATRSARVLLLRKEINITDGDLARICA